MYVHEDLVQGEYQLNPLEEENMFHLQFKFFMLGDLNLY
jgi:hypothetical protein